VVLVVIVKTASGSTYEFNDDLTEFRRDDVAPFNGMIGGFHTGWNRLTQPANIEEGAKLLLPIENGYYVQSTPVVSIERKDS
jgi:hypothetical protein